jgi:hypothetical protein
VRGGQVDGCTAGVGHFSLVSAGCKRSYEVGLQTPELQTEGASRQIHKTSLGPLELGGALESWREDDGCWD